jgi:glyoxylase-like metal-dependent hydrolase (beta-lactamase superfamily II)
LKIGAYQVDVLRCGEFRLDGGAMFGVVPRVVWERLTPPDASNRIRLQTNCLLIRGEGVTILVDTGVGDKEDDAFHARFAVQRGPGVPGALEAVGLTPEDITHVVISHLHWDHAGGATRRDEDGKLVPAFPRARYVVQRGEWQDALAPSERTRASYMPDNFMPLQEADCLQLVDGETEIAPGVIVFPAPGHNRHMQCVRVKSAGDAGVFLADLVPTRHHLRPAFIMGYDLYPATTLETKRELLGSIHAGRWLLFFDHDPEVPVATLDRDERGHFVAVPVTT